MRERYVLGALASLNTQIHAGYAHARTTVAPVSGNREQRRRQAREIRARLKAVSDTNAPLIEAVRQETARIALIEAEARIQNARRMAALDALRERLRTSTVSSALERVSEEQSVRIARLLERAVTRQWTPEQAQAEIMRLIGGGATPTGAEWRTMTIARTELGAAERSGLLAAYDADENITHWVWVSRLAKDTCPYCWSMHGSVHLLSESMATHPNCLCRPMPVLPRTRRKSGQEIFDELDEHLQREILGPAAHAAYEAGAITLTDLAARTHHPELGTVGGTRSLTAAIGADEALKYRREALSSALS